MNNQWEVLLIPGFMGESSDWNSVKTYLTESSLRVSVYDLSNDFFNPSITTFNTWTENFRKHYVSTGSKCVLVGYSLGARLLMNLIPRENETFFLCAGHPGLSRGHAERIERDRKWYELGQSLSSQKWFEKWNAQDVFNNDSKRPVRDLDENVFSNNLKALDIFSLGKMKNCRPFLREYSQRIHWAYGEKDLKFSLMAEEFSQILGPNRVHEIADSGHGIPFDRPQALAQLILEIYHNDN